jgi:transcriptional regulator with XRE-family HTH domain
MPDGENPSRIVYQGRYCCPLHQTPALRQAAGFRFVPAYLRARTHNFEPFFSAPFKFSSSLILKVDYKRLGERIREERQRLNLTQATLAEAVDISDTYMGAIERGERSLTLDTLVRLVNRLGVTVDYMLADYVSESDPNILAQFKQITDNQPLERKQLAIKVLRTIFTHFETDDSSKGLL